MKTSLFGRLLLGLFGRINTRRPWHRVGRWAGVFNLMALRIQLREKNLHDTRTPRKPEAPPREFPAPDPMAKRFRTPGGKYNDLSDPEMGMAGTRFARNIPLEHAFPEPMPGLMEPSPREISQKLMRRTEFVPARTLNLLAAAWIQFQTHDWFNHARDKKNHLEIPVGRDDDWFEKPMRVERTLADHTRCDDDKDLPPTFINTESHWWDASGIYGSTPERERRVRQFQDGKLILKDGRLPLDPETGFATTGFAENWWIGLGILHTLFTAEHNAICDHLKKSYPDWSDEHLFGTARLVNSALMAKIHTVEWTPAITDHPVLHTGMRANWWGLAEEKLYRLVGRIGSGEVISGIPGSGVDHHGSPYQLTEEFAAVYRLHPLIPDNVEIYRSMDGQHVETLPFKMVALRNAEKVVERGITSADLWYSMGIEHPGAVCLHNFPSFLMDLTLPDGVRLDLAAVDIMRDRERGIPRYNQFRRLMHMKPAETFEELAAKPEWAKELKEMYKGDIERVDLQIGMHAEVPPAGFGFSDTAFRVFILMASRRLKSDRFIADCYTPEYYTKEGLQWIADNHMRTVILRHYPELEPALKGSKNAFAPWKRISDSRPSAKAAKPESAKEHATAASR
ncbi:MAG: peroxidase family protein [Gemmatimonadota bacterium]